MINSGDSLPVRLISSQYDLIEKNVVSLFMICGITDVPIDPFVIADRRGYIIKPFSSLDIETLSSLPLKEVDAFSGYDPTNHTFIIAYDDEKSNDRIRFTLMHEIGHIEMGHRCESELARKIADYYAAYALAPTPLIHLKECKNVSDVAKVFGVSNACADFSLQRYLRWINIPSDYKPYEEQLVNLFR